MKNAIYLSMACLVFYACRPINENPQERMTQKSKVHSVYYTEEYGYTAMYMGEDGGAYMRTIPSECTYGVGRHIAKGVKIYANLRYNEHPHYECSWIKNCRDMQCSIYVHSIDDVVVDSYEQ